MTGVERRSHERIVSELLDTVRTREFELERLRVRGVRGNLVTALEADLAATREQIARVASA